MPTLSILADDLTGANDTGVQFARQGVSCALSPLWTEKMSVPDLESPVWVFNTESRHCPPKEAARRVAKAAEFAKAHGTKIIYKKTDSVLRGPVGAELEAVSKVWKSPVIFVPAFPAAGRTVRNGNLYVDGVPLNETAFSTDPLAPVTTASIAGLLHSPMATVTLEQLRSGKADFKSLENIVLVEGETEEDLQQTAELARNQTLPACWAGPAAFAFHLARILNLKSGPVASAACPAPILLVNGSLHPASIAQQNCAIAAGFVPAELSPESSNSTRATKALIAGKNTILYHACLTPRDPAGVNRRLTEAAKQILDEVLPGTLLVFGGETSQSVLRNIGATGCRILNQIDWGIVLIEAKTPGGTLNIITKSGGFGTADFIRRIIQ